MDAPDPSGGRREDARPFTVWQLWGRTAKESFRTPAGPAQGERATGPLPAKRSSFRVIWLFVAVIGIVAGTVCVFQARYQVRIEHGVTGSYQVEGCGYRRSRTQEDAWVCDGRFRLNDTGEARWARLNSYQPEQPRGRVTVMAAGPDDDVVWLPTDVSSARKWTWSAAWYGAAVIAVALYVYFGLRQRRRRRR